MSIVRKLFFLSLSISLVVGCSHFQSEPKNQAAEPPRTPSSDLDSGELPLPPEKFAEVYCRPSPLKKGNYYPAYRSNSVHIIIASNPQWAASVERTLLVGVPLEICELGISAAASTGYACYSERTYGTSMLYVNAVDKKADLPAAHDNLGECVQSAMGTRGPLFCSRDLMDQKYGIDRVSKKASIWIQNRHKWIQTVNPPLTKAWALAMRL